MNAFALTLFRSILRRVLPMRVAVATALAFALAATALPARRDHDPARGESRRHRGLAGAGAGGAADRGRLRFRRRLGSGSAGQGRHRQSCRLAARRGRRRSRFQGLCGSARAQGHRDEFLRRARQSRRVAAHAYGKPRRGLRHVAPGADRAALRCFRRRAQSGADLVDVAPADDEPRRYREPALVGDRLRGPSLWPAGRAARRNAAEHHHRRFEDPIRIVCWRGKISRLPWSATSTPRP